MLFVSAPAGKSLGKLPEKDRERIERALDEMMYAPFSGDIKRLHPVGWRRRVGEYRVLYRLITEERQIVVTDIVRRTSTTY